MRRAIQHLMLLSLGSCTLAGVASPAAPTPSTSPSPEQTPTPDPEPTLYLLHARLRSVPSSGPACERGQLQENAAIRLRIETRSVIPEDFLPSEFHQVYLPCQVLRDLQRGDEQLLVERRCFSLLVAEPVAVDVGKWSSELGADRDLVRIDAGRLGELHTRDGIDDSRTWVVHEWRKASCRDFQETPAGLASAREWGFEVAGQF